MRIRIQPWWYAALLTVACITLMLGVYWVRFRRPASPAELASLLPAKDATVFYLDVDVVRSSGFLARILASKTPTESEYQQFVDQTQFDYKQDMDAIAVAVRKGNWFFALRGRFHWKELMAYAVQQGGTCHNGFCMFRGSAPNRHISFYAVRNNVLGLAVSASDEDAAWLVHRGSGQGWTPPDQPSWMVVPAARLNDTESIPEGMRPYAAALKGTQEILLTAGPQNDQLTLKLQVTCDNASTASTLLVDLEGAANTVRRELAKTAGKSKAGDLPAVLAAGAFRRDDRRVYGEWRVEWPTLEAMLGDSN